MNYVTWQELALLVLFILICAVCIYLIIFIRNLNKSVNIIRTLLYDNKEGIDKSIKTLPEISANIVEITSAGKNNIRVVEEVIHSIGETVEMTAATAHTIKNDVLGRLKGLIELVELIWKVFFKSRDDTGTHNQDKKEEQGS